MTLQTRRLLAEVDEGAGPTVRARDARGDAAPRGRGDAVGACDQERYRYQDVTPPFEKLRSLPDVEKHLRPGVTIASLEEQARAMSDLEAAVALKRARARLFELIARDSDPRRRRSA